MFRLVTQIAGPEQSAVEPLRRLPAGRDGTETLATAKAGWPFESPEKPAPSEVEGLPALQERRCKEQRHKDEVKIAIPI